MIILPAEKRIDWKHAPVALIGIILVNIFVFFFYQSGDDGRYYAAVESYMQQGYLKKEWPLYRQYLKDQQQSGKLQDLNGLYEEEDYYAVAGVLLEDDAFYRYLDDNGPSLFYQDFYYAWSDIRPRIQEHIDSISYLRFGLKPNDLSVPDLIVHQFLHGGFMHLVGNMVFLMICGFVVEAALGHLTFLAFYLIGGVTAGLTHSLFDLSSATPLVGASGAISAVMAMYLVLYRWRRIQFFYWFYIVAGYFRAPALIILPVYIAREVYSYWFEDGSNVAFMAHAGGFVAGALLVALTAAFRPDVLNADYLARSDDDVDPYRRALAEIYAALDKYRFDQAAKLVLQAIKEQGNFFELRLLYFNLMKLKGGEALVNAANQLLEQDDLSDNEIRRQETVWLNLPVSDSGISNKALLNAAVNFTRLDNITSAGKIFMLLQQRGEAAAGLSKLAMCLARASARLNQAEQHSRYEKIAGELLASV